MRISFFLTLCVLLFSCVLVSSSSWKTRAAHYRRRAPSRPSFPRANGYGEIGARHEENSHNEFGTAKADLLSGSHGNDLTAPDTFCAIQQLSNSPASYIVYNITRSWAPLGVDHFFTLLSSSFYDNSAIFRVVPGFVAQFGIAGSPAVNNQWNNPILDDPVTQSNQPGTIVYATSGPNTRTTQLFVNYGDNSGLDSQGFAPFGKIVKGFELIQNIDNPTPGNSGGVDQNAYKTLGNSWLLQNYPQITMINSFRVIQGASCPME